MGINTNNMQMTRVALVLSAALQLACLSPVEGGGHGHHHVRRVAGVHRCHLLAHMRETTEKQASEARQKNVREVVAAVLAAADSSLTLRK